MWPKISIVTPSYNQADFLEDTIQSVISQDYPNLEYIIIDGGSDDGSLEIIKKYAEFISYWVSEKDDGQTDALIKGFQRATGSILGWLCSDDLLMPTALEEVSKFFQTTPQAQVVYGDTAFIDIEGQLIAERREIPFDPFVLAYDHNFIPQPSTFWRSEIYKKVNGLNDSFDVAMDADLWLRFSEVAEIFHVESPWSKMRIYPEQKTYRLLEKKEAEKKLLRERHFGPTNALGHFSRSAFAKARRIHLKLLNGCY